MDIKEICPCHNLDCPNHGVCENCTSRHLHKGSLNYCGFHTILPTLREAIDASPDSPTARKLTALIENTQAIYAKLLDKHGLSGDNQQRLLKKNGGFQRLLTAPVSLLVRQGISGTPLFSENQLDPNATMW